MTSAKTSKNAPNAKGKPDSSGVSEIALLFRTLRIKKGYTQGALAEKLGIHINTLGKWERGEGAPTAECLLALKAIPANRKKPPLRGGPRPLPETES